MYFYCMTVCLCMTTLTELFPCFSLSCKVNARVKPAKTGHGPHSFYFLFVLCIFVLFYVLCVSFSVLFVYTYTELLPPVGYPITVKYIIYIYICIYIKHKGMPFTQKLIFRTALRLIFISWSVSGVYVYVYSQTVLQACHIIWRLTNTKEQRH
jgi:hypothetical protein